jgi:hypothetical protein
MQVTINKDKVELLETLLDQEIIQLRVQIHHTWRYEYKQMLKRREELVEKLLERIREASKAA